MFPTQATRTELNCLIPTPFSGFVILTAPMLMFCRYSPCTYSYTWPSRHSIVTLSPIIPIRTIASSSYTYVKDKKVEHRSVYWCVRRPLRRQPVWRVRS